MAYYTYTIKFPISHSESLNVNYIGWNNWKEPKNIDPYIEILVDEITSLNNKLCFDAYQEENFNLKVDILLHVLDYPYHNNLFHCHGKCEICMVAILYN